MSTIPQHAPAEGTTSHTTLSLPLIAALILFALLPHSALAQSFSVLYTFLGQEDGGIPESSLVMDAAGNLYGTTVEGGNYTCSSSCGNVFKLDPNGNETNLHTFNSGQDGSFPYISGVTLDRSGNLYGVTSFGGTGRIGIVYKLDPAGNETILHNFPGKAGDGNFPQEPSVVLDAAGNLYGTTIQGGGAGCRGFGCGTVFRLDKNEREVAVALNDSASAPTALVFNPATGKLYGTTIQGGGAGCSGLGCGTVFSVDKQGKLTVVYTFQGAPDGATPLGGLAVDKSGNVYGTTWSGGNSTACPNSGCGTVFKVTPTGKATVLYRFSGPDGLIPYSGVVVGRDGALYGTTFGGGASGWGTIFRVDRTGNESVLHSFTDGDDGASPMGGFAVGRDGTLYGTASQGGATAGDLCFPFGCGTVFKITR